jgi:glycosyltransferase involved in cell wall biosynthesis
MTDEREMYGRGAKAGDGRDDGVSAGERWEHLNAGEHEEHPSAGERRRVLVVANPFPPMASGGNARIVRFCRHLPEHGWEPVVLTARASGPVPVPDDLQVVRAAAPTPAAAYALARRTDAALRASRRPGGSAAPPASQAAAGQAAAGQANAEGPAASREAAYAAAPTGARRTSRQKTFNDWLFVPDTYVGWILPALRAGKHLLAGQRVDAVFSSYPRGSAHLVAAELARAGGLPWLADYRDPWTTGSERRFASPAHKRAHAALEEHALRHAAQVTAVNAAILADLQRAYPFLQARGEVISNGFDPDEPADRVDLGDGFWFVHTGRLYQRMGEVSRFLQALAALPDDVRVLFLGVEGTQVRAEAERLGIGHRVRVEPFGAHAYALGCQRAADALLLITLAETESLTGKVFEYLASGKPVFAITPAGSAAQQLLQRAGSSAWAEPQAAMTEPLDRFVGAVRDGGLPARDLAVVAECDAGALTARLAALLDGMTR